MSRDLRAFVTDFVVPLLAGDDVWIGRPLRPRDRDEWGMHISGTSLPDVAFWRLRRAQLLTAHPELPDPDIDELSLWLGLHNLLVFEHPTADVAENERAALARDVAAVADSRRLAAIAITMDAEFAEGMAHRSLALDGATGALNPWKKKRGWFR